MASFHIRSNSFPSQSHPLVNAVEDHLERLKASKASSTSSTCANLASLRDLHEAINTMIQIPSAQQALACEQGENWMNELLEGSLRLVDLCGLSMDIARLTKESVQDLESSIRRQADEVSIYLASRKKVQKMAKKCIKNLRTSNQDSTPLPAIGMMLREAESLDLATLKSVLVLLSGEKEKSSKMGWSTLFSKFSQSTRRQNCEDLGSLDFEKSVKNMDSKSMLRQLKASEMSIQEIEECLEALFRSLVKTRVSLLNALSH